MLVSKRFGLLFVSSYIGSCLAKVSVVGFDFSTLEMAVSCFPVSAARFQSVEQQHPTPKNKERMIKQIEMFSKRKWLLSGITLVGVLSATGAAKAATLTYSHTTTTQPTDFTDTYTFPTFDPSLGTLQSVEVDLSGTVQGGFTYSNPTSKSANITVGEQATVDLNESANGSNLAEVIPITSQRIFVPANGSGSVTLPPVAQSIVQPYTDSGTLAAFIGGPGSTISLDFNAAGQTSYSGPGNFTTSFNVQAGGTSAIVYTYTTPASVPEPSNMLAVGLIGGLGVFTTVRKLQKRQAQAA